ncbi:hypothetical protein ZWY2020_022038, partial [Hordeum vulgare]
MSRSFSRGTSRSSTTQWSTRWSSYPSSCMIFWVCGNSHGLIRKYGLMCCRLCFCSNAKDIGFIK